MCIEAVEAKAALLSCSIVSAHALDPRTHIRYTPVHPAPALVCMSVLARSPGTHRVCNPLRSTAPNPAFASCRLRPRIAGPWVFRGCCCDGLYFATRKTSMQVKLAEICEKIQQATRTRLEAKKRKRKKAPSRGACVGCGRGGSAGGRCRGAPAWRGRWNPAKGWGLRRLWPGATCCPARPACPATS